MTTLERLISGDRHRADEDCIIDPDTDLCIGCRHARGPECPCCHARIFHRDNCPFTLTITEAEPQPPLVCLSDPDSNISASGPDLPALIYMAAMAVILAIIWHIS